MHESVVGSHVAGALLERELGVRILDKRPEQFRPALPGVEDVFGDFGDPATLIEALTGSDAVVHLAKTTVPGTAKIDPVPETPSPYDAPRVGLDIALACQSLGCAPEIGLDEGLAETWKRVHTHTGSQVRLQ